MGKKALKERVSVLEAEVDRLRREISCLRQAPPFGPVLVEPAKPVRRVAPFEVVDFPRPAESYA